MNIQKFVAYLNKQKGWHIEAAYYSEIIQWRDWWRGDYAPFHNVREMTLKGNTVKRPMYRLRMPKRACEDWASLLLNDKTTLTVANMATARWLCGEDADQTGGVLGSLDFWPHANELVELAFRSGTGAFVMSCEGLQLEGGRVAPSPAARLCLDYLPAECILPITIHHGRIIDAAFASEVTVEGKSCVYLQTHTLTEAGYRITNEYFTSENEDSEEEGYSPAPLPAGMAASFSTGSSVPWFSILRPAVVKNRTGGPGLGQAVFAEAIDQAKQCDLAFDNYCRDLYLGGKKVFYSASMLQAHVGPDGTAHWATPDDVRQQLFVKTNKSDPDAPDDWHEYNPDLRTEQNGKAVQDALDYFSFKCGLAARQPPPDRHRGGPAGHRPGAAVGRPQPAGGRHRPRDRRHRQLRRQLHHRQRDPPSADEGRLSVRFPAQVPVPDGVVRHERGRSTQRRAGSVPGGRQRARSIVWR